MSVSKALEQRSEGKCELCQSLEGLNTFQVAPKLAEELEHQVAVCSNCLDELNLDSTLNENHWRCLNDSIWNPNPSVQVVAYRLLNKLQDQGANWAQDLLGMMYMEDATREWAEDLGEAKLVHKDVNGHVLQAGDSVTLIQDLNVKGANFTAKRGTAVRRIRLVSDNAEHIEGKVDGQQIVILTKYVKKS